MGAIPQGAIATAARVLPLNVLLRARVSKRRSHADIDHAPGEISIKALCQYRSYGASTTVCAPVAGKRMPRVAVRTQA